MCSGFNWRLFDVVVVCMILVGETYICYILVLELQSLLLRIFLNLVYFIPYLASFSVLTFHCYSYWKSVEEKYFVLKQLIYEECRDIQRVNNGCIPSRHPKRKENVLPVVSRELYDKVREELLPYHTNLFYFSLKVLMLSIFAYGIFELVNTLHALKISAVVRILITFSVSIVPYIFNMEKLNASEARKKAWLEKIKLNVKYIVEELTLEDPELARTVLIIQDKSNDTVDREHAGNSYVRERTAIRIICIIKGDVKSVLRRPTFQWVGPDHWNVNISHLPNFLELNL